jgi:hypothetical protein
VFAGTAVAALLGMLNVATQEVRMFGIKLAETTLLILLAAIAVIVLAYYFIKKKPDALAEDGSPMPVIARRILVWYLLLLGLSLIYLIAHVSAADFPEGGWKAELTWESAKPDSPSPDTPVLGDVIPQTNLANASVVDVTITGQNFTSDCKVRFNGQEKPSTYIGPQSMVAQLEQTSVVGQEPIRVDVVNTQKKTSSNYRLEIIRKARAEVSLFGAKVWMSKELQLLLLAVFAGALGSFVHALKSFADFIGNRTLTASWFWWYITRPFLGAALALIFYAVLRGGFMAGTPADAKAVNSFGVIAVGALVGMFADKASDKLADIFDTLFKGADSRSGKLGAPVIDHFDPATIAHGANATDLKIIGERLGSVKQVKFDGAVHDHGAVTDTQVIVNLTAQDLAAAKTIKISVVGDNGESPAKDFQIT